MTNEEAIEVLRTNNNTLKSLATGDKESDKTLLDKIDANNTAIEALEKLKGDL